MANSQHPKTIEEFEQRLRARAEGKKLAPDFAMGIAKSKFTHYEKQRLIDRLLVDGVIDEDFLKNVLLCEDICAQLARCRERREYNLFEYIKALEAPGKAVVEPIRDENYPTERRLCEKHGAIVTQVLTADPFTADQDLTILFSYESVSADSKSWRELKLHFILTNKDGDIVEALVREVKSLMELIKTIHSIDSIEGKS
ncbi:MAG: hypothetical protein ICV62_02035 [Cyanobacteria bacterium Co-bin13]|nr:hypothetical protein [Cyanobacteria bacterium Co-bin13]